MGKSLKLVLFIVILLLLTSCSAKTNYATDEPFIIVKYSPAGPDDYRNLYSHNYSIADDGTLMLYTETGGERSRLIIGEDVPVYEMELDQAKVEKVKQIIEENKFWKLEEDLTTPSEDGAFYYITVNLTDRSKKVGGLNPDHPHFIEIQNYVFDLVDREDARVWKEEIEAHIEQMNP